MGGFDPAQTPFAQRGSLSALSSTLGVVSNRPQTLCFGEFIKDLLLSSIWTVLPPSRYPLFKREMAKLLKIIIIIKIRFQYRTISLASIGEWRWPLLHPCLHSKSAPSFSLALSWEPSQLPVFEDHRYNRSPS